MMEARDPNECDSELHDASPVPADVTTDDGEVHDQSSTNHPTAERVEDDPKRSLEGERAEETERAAKKAKPEEDVESEAAPGETSARDSEFDQEEDLEEDKSETEKKESEDEFAPIPAATEGISTYDDNDVLSGRGGGTNVHPGNRNFRDLINLHRRVYLKARKNDKPAMSRAIVRSIRDNNGKFLKKDEDTGLWFEIGDDAAREKTSQALRQRAPEMRKLLFDAELEEARMVGTESHPQQQQQQQQQPPQQQQQVHHHQPPMMMGFPAAMAGVNPAMFNQAFLAMANKGGVTNPNASAQEAYAQQMFAATAAMYPNAMNRFDHHQANSSS
jgi:hypothetical protein